ncbi:hypothetical protein WG902_22170 [Ramlibacter sp. PS3R-8]|uniref:hypothetical protein n=1 Tax=Ramlibacter sp. PS3R-8 TaxID=3133437 RepID=UPI00309CC629
MNRLQAESQRLYGTGRAAVLELAGAGGWTELAKVWQGVQAELELPAPGIAVNGSDAHQLWFSFPQAVAAPEAERFLASLRAHFLREVPPERIRFNLHPAPMPPFQVGPDRWSAFVTQDLATLFDAGPWLDMPPGVEAQAELLSRLQSMAPQALQRAMQRMKPVASASMPLPQGAEQDDPRSFLLRVMNDAHADMHLRIEAAKALLLAQDGQRR